jgi:hypothetical protein
MTTSRCPILPRLHIPFVAEKHYTDQMLRENFRAIQQWADRLYIATDCGCGGGGLDPPM